MKCPWCGSDRSFTTTGNARLCVRCHSVFRAETEYHPLGDVVEPKSRILEDMKDRSLIKWHLDQTKDALRAARNAVDALQTTLEKLDA